MYDLKLYDYQQEIIDSKEEQIICNWARPLGKTYTLICKILTHRLNKVLWVGDFYNLRHKISDVIKSSDDLKKRIRCFSSTKNMISIKFYDNNSEVNIFNHINYGFNEEEVDLLVFDNILLYKIRDLKAKQIISMITINNYNKSLQRLLPDIEIKEQGIDTVLKHELAPKSCLDDLKEQSIYKYYDEIDILATPENLKEKSKNNRLEELLMSYIVEPDTIFLIQTLAKLQTEYDEIVPTPSEDNLQKRETLIKMIINIRRELSTQVNLHNFQNNSYNFEFNVDKLQATEDEADSFAKRIIGKVKERGELK